MYALHANLCRKVRRTDKNSRNRRQTTLTKHCTTKNDNAYVELMLCMRYMPSSYFSLSGLQKNPKDQKRKNRTFCYRGTYDLTPSKILKRYLIPLLSRTKNQRKHITLLLKCDFFTLLNSFKNVILSLEENMYQKDGSYNNIDLKI